MQNVLEVKGLTKKYGDQYALTVSSEKTVLVRPR